MTVPLWRDALSLLCAMGSLGVRFGVLLCALRTLFGLLAVSLQKREANSDGDPASELPWYPANIYRAWP